MVIYIYIASNPKTAKFAAALLPDILYSDDDYHVELTPQLTRPVSPIPDPDLSSQIDYSQIEYREVVRKIEPAVFQYKRIN